MKNFAIAALFAAVAAVTGVAAPAAAQEMVPPASIPCTVCHDSSTRLVSKRAQFSHSKHGSGEAYLRGASKDCAGCHGSEGTEARIEAGLPPHDPSIQGVVNVSPFTCRTCHDIHTTYTAADFSLTGDAKPVKLERTEGTFDGGLGNLCSNCHQIRNALPVATNGQIEVTNTRFGTHHSPQSQMLLGEGGLGVAGRPSAHYQRVENVCVGCHMGENRDHTFNPQLANCQDCHANLDTFDRNGVQTEVSKLLDQVKARLIARGALQVIDQEQQSVPGTYPENVAAALWDYTMVVEDKSKGVHNSSYTRALLQYALDQL